MCISLRDFAKASGPGSIPSEVKNKNLCGQGHHYCIPSQISHVEPLSPVETGDQRTKKKSLPRFGFHHLTWVRGDLQTQMTITKYLQITHQHLPHIPPTLSSHRQ